MQLEVLFSKNRILSKRDEELLFRSAGFFAWGVVLIATTEPKLSMNRELPSI